MKQNVELKITIPDTLAGKRLDQALSECCADYSRSRITQWIRDGHVTVDGASVAAKYKVKGNELVSIHASITEAVDWQAQPIDLEILYEDDDLIVVNKPAGMVVHPAAGNPDSTLVNALLHHCPALQQLPRAGIIHRLDKDTSGLLITAKTLPAHTHLTQAMQDRLIKREYLAVVNGTIIAGGSVDAPLGRHPTQRIKRAVVQSGKHALTHYRVKERFRAHTLILCQLETGRTHQIRVHMAHVHYPLVGDPVYGGRTRVPKHCDEALLSTLQQFKRQALHAWHLQFQHPTQAETLDLTAPIPDDFQHLVELLREDTQRDH